MKTFIFCTILFCAGALPVLGALTDADLDKIRLIIKEEIKEELKPIKAEVTSIKEDTGSLKIAVARLEGRIIGIEGRMTGMEERFTGVEGRFTGIEKQISHATNVTYGLIALIVVAIGIPAWRSKRDRDQERKIDELTREIEGLKQSLITLQQSE